MSQIISEIDEYTILYTSEPQKKTPKFHDGVLKHYKYNSKFQVISSSNIVVSSEFKRNYIVSEGDEFKVGSVLVNVECLNSRERRDISGFIGKGNSSNKTVTSVITPVKTPNVPSNLSKPPGSGEKTIGVRKRRIGLSKLNTPSKRAAIATQSPINETPTSTPSGTTSYNKSNSIRGYNLLKKESNSLPSKKLNGRTTGLTTLIGAGVDEDNIPLSSLPSSIPGQGTGKIRLNSLPQHPTPSTTPLREQKERKIISPVSSKVDKPAVSSTKKAEPVEIDYSSEEDEFLERLLQISKHKHQVEPQGKHFWPSMIPSDLSNLMNVVPERRKLKSIPLQKLDPQPQTKNNQSLGRTKHPIKLTEIGSDCIGKSNKTATKQTIPLTKIITDINKKMTPVKSVFETFKGAEIPSFEISEHESNNKDDEYDVHWKEESPKRLRTNPELKSRSQNHVTNTPSKIDFKTLKELRGKKEHEEDDEIIATPSLELNEDIVVIKTKTHDFKKGKGNGKVYRISELG